jgi:hypothetical protein
MDDRNNSNRGPRRNLQGGRGQERTHQHQPIDYWEDIKNILDRDRDVGRRHLSFRIGMQRPVFVDGTMGYYRLNTFIDIDGRYIQLSTSALAAMANYFHYNRDRILNAIDEVRNMNARIDKATEEREARRNQNGRDDRDATDRFKGLDDEDERPEDDGEEPVVEEDYEEVTVVNEEKSGDGSDGVPESGPSPDGQPRRVRRVRTD